MRKIGFLLVLAMLAASVGAQVVEVNVYRPDPGQAGLTFAYGNEAKSIHEKLGARVGVGRDTEGRMHFALQFENWTEWATYGDKLDKSAEWSAFQAKIAASPSGVLEDQYFLNTVSDTNVGSVYQVFIWHPVLGRGADLFAAAAQAKPLHEKAGARVGIYADQLNRLHYVMGFDSWAEWGKLNDTPNPEFQEFMAKLNADPPGELIRVYTVSRE